MKTRRARPSVRPRKTRQRATSPRRRRAAANPQGALAPQNLAPRRQPETLRLRGIEPSFTVNDLNRSIQFYTETLGFFVGERWTTDGGVLRGVMLKAGTCSLGLSQDDWAQGKDRKKGVGMRIWCQTEQDINVLAARIEKAGGRLTDGPRDEPWGARSLSVQDPDGFRLTIYREG